MTVVGLIAGWLVGAALMIAVPVFAGLPPPISWLGVGPTLFVSVILLIVVVGVLYLCVSLATANGQPATMNLFGEFCFGALIGVNAGANFMLAFAAMALLFWPLGLAVAPLVATVLSLINALAAFQGLARAPWFAAVLGWSSWAMPMSWPVTAFGLVVFVIGIVSFAAGVPFRPGFEWWTGTVILHGGVVFVARNGYNTGNFSFFHPDFGNTAPWINTDTTPPLPAAGTVQGMTFHETGHTLNVAACGSIFHVIGAIDQNALTGAFSFAEQLAEGHLHDAGAPWIDWWRPQIATIGGGTANVPPTSPNTNLVEPVQAVPIGTSVTFDITNTAIVPSPPTDANSYPQGRVNPGVIPPVGILWTLTTVPAGSTAAIEPPNAPAATFTTDVGGDYIVRLHYSDGANGSPGVALLTGPLSPAPGFPAPPASPPFDAPPVSAVEARTVAQLATQVGVPVPLSSAGSTAGSLFMSFDWVVTEQVAGAGVIISDPGDPSPTFTADQPGEYVVTLTITAGANSATHSSTTRVFVT